jgi:hypothetical protein
MPSRPKARKHGHREPSGRLSRRIEHVKARTDMTEAEAKSVGIAARIRHGIPAHLADLSDAGRPNVGTLHGRMRLMNDITADQWTAAEWYRGARQRWLRAIQAPERIIEASEGAGGDGISFREAKEAWDEIVDCLLEVSTQIRSPIIAAFDVLLVREQMVEHMVGDLRVGLNAIHRRFLQGKTRRAA